MKKVIVDYRISDVEAYNLESLGYEILLCPKCTDLYKAVDGHPDMQLNIINNNEIIVHKNMNENFINRLKDSNYNIIYAQSFLKNKYPYDIILNAISIGSAFIHNLKYTDNILITKMQENKKALLNVHQGYTKCSTCIVNEKAAITSDKGIAAALSSLKIDVLILPPGDIELPHLDYGFIGGCCGLLEEGLIAFYGNLKHYKYGQDILDFLKKYKVQAYMLSDNHLIDRGSIFTIN